MNDVLHQYSIILLFSVYMITVSHVNKDNEYSRNRIAYSLATTLLDDHSANELNNFSLSIYLSKMIKVIFSSSLSNIFSHDDKTEAER